MVESLPTQKISYGSNPLDTDGLCLLSLDGGGVRGLSTLYALKSLMTQLNTKRRQENRQYVKPCEVFDLIGGTNTGGLVAIMLGRLEMDVDECITAYTKIMTTIFEKSSTLTLSWASNAKTQVGSERLKSAIEEAISRTGFSAADLFKSDHDCGCRTFVCAVAKETAGVTRLRSYQLPDESGIRATICEATLSTLATAGLFEPVSIGARQFVDGALGANNPVEEVEGEAANIWSSGTDLKALVKCFISIGTGNPGKKDIPDNIQNISSSLIRIATETEETERKFVARWAKQYDEKRYFRFNVDQGLQDVGLDEYKERGKIEAATFEYLAHQDRKLRVRDCVQNLQQKQNPTEISFASVVEEYHIQSIIERQKTATTAHFIVPFERNRKFVGRDSYLNQLERLLFDEKHTKVAVSGLGGVGKTQVALELAYRTKQKHPDYSILWIPATSHESLEQAFKGITHQLKLPGLADKNANSKKLLQHHLSERLEKWLLVIDNVDHVDIWSNELRDYLPKSQYGSVVCTTRSRKVAVKIASSVVIEVTEADEGMAMELLSKSLINNPEYISQNRQKALDLIGQLTHLPLAIVQAAAYINENGITLQDYISLLNEQERDVVDLLSEDFEDEGRYKDTNNPVATTWLISFQHIRKIDPLAAEYLSFMSCVNPKGIPQSLLPPGQSRKKEIDAIGLLNAYSFVIRQGDSSLSVHRLVHLATRNWLRGEGSLAQFTENTMKRLEEVFPDREDDDWNAGKPYLPHVSYVLEDCQNREIDPYKIQDSTLIWNFASCLRGEGRYKEAETWFLRIVESRKQALGTGHDQTLEALHSLALCYMGLQRWKEAEEISLHLMQDSVRVLGDEDLRTLSRMLNLGIILEGQRRWKEAEDILLKTLEITKRVLGMDHSYTSTSMSNLASVYKAQGRWREAESLERQFAEVNRKMVGHEHPTKMTIINLGSLAVSYFKQGRRKEAEMLYRQLVETSKKFVGEEHPMTMAIVGNLASTLSDQGKLKEAEGLQLQVLKFYREMYGGEHSDALTVKSNLALTYKNQGRWYEARKMLMDVMAIRQRTMGLEHPDTLLSVDEVANILAKEGQLEELKVLRQTVTETLRKVLGDNHPSTLRSRNEFAMVIARIKKQDLLGEAEEMIVQVIDARKEHLGEQHPDTLVSMSDLAWIYSKQGRGQEAEELYRQVLELRVIVFGEDHYLTLKSKMAFLSTLWKQGQFKEADELALQVIETHKRVFGPDHPDTINSMADMASIYRDEGRFEEAKELITHVVETRRRELGADHPYTLGGVAELAQVLRDQGHHDRAIALMEVCLLSVEKMFGPQHRRAIELAEVIDLWKLEEMQMEEHTASKGLKKSKTW